MKKSEEKKLVAKITKNLVAHRNIPVCTTAQLADYYGTTVDVITQNFRRHQERFEDGKHYYKLEGEVLKNFICNLQNEGHNLQVSSMTRTLYLWTERGAARHAKILDTDKAWEVFDLLEETYFDSEKFHWQQTRNDSKIATRKMTDAIKNFLIPLALKQGMDEKKKDFLYNNYNRLINKCAGVKASSRDLLTESQLYEMNKMSNIAGTLIEKYVAQEIEYHEIYFKVKDYLKKYVEISML